MRKFSNVRALVHLPLQVMMESTFENSHQARSSARVHSELRNKMVPVARQMGPHVCREVSL